MEITLKKDYNEFVSVTVDLQERRCLLWQAASEQTTKAESSKQEKVNAKMVDINFSTQTPQENDIVYMI